MRNFIFNAMNDQNDSVGGVLLKPVLLCLSWIYGLALLIIYPLKANKYKLPKPVISVGNITMGGSGKTPLVIYIVEYLKTKGFKPAILTRGYMPKGSNIENQQSDEVLMLKEILPDVPIVVGKNRYQSAMNFLQKNDCDVFVMDDGFQHWKLARDLEIVAINSLNPFGNRRLLPRGILREKLGALNRADFIVLTKTDLSSSNFPEIINALSKNVSKAEVVQSAHKPQGLVNLTDQKQVALDFLKGKSVCLVASIGDPQAFESTVAGLGANIEEFFIFGDHYVYNSSSTNNIQTTCQKCNIDIVIATHKDAVKLKRLMENNDFSDKIYVLNIGLELKQGKEKFLERIDCLLNI